ncbi:carboxymuconolactone decarboxylase family protein [Mycobacterium sp. 1081908.1]|uniref:carboxymuconolactone decarboxylase family protein n=1 Tax=Mycobacterium sp. 1081908.1 TaxID=1834066 RepID=UPI0007FF2235|nr:carboxymuconolactone decarboxylase family protein [Mycobacterium sp. 1081908.1]OBK48021.1 hypothetical protein A5655_05425 [Mycobacterium sp. 1081908.1]
MTRVEPVRADTPLAAFDTARGRYGWLPNTIRVMARGTNAADLYLAAGEFNARGTVLPLARERIAIHVAETNGCEYCRTAHTLAARAVARTADADHRDVEAQVEFAARMLHTRGQLSDADLDDARTAGIDAQTMIDVAAVIAENMLGNLINNLARTELDPMLRQRATREEIA